MLLERKDLAAMEITRVNQNGKLKEWFWPILRITCQKLQVNASSLFIEYG